MSLRIQIITLLTFATAVGATSNTRGDERSQVRRDADAAVPQNPRDPILKNRPLKQLVSLTNPPLWAREVKGNPDELDWFSATGPLVLDDQRVLIGRSILDLRTGKEVGRLKIDNLHPTYMRLSPNRRYLLLCAAVPQPPEVFLDYLPTVMQVWDVATLKQYGKTIDVSADQVILNGVYSRADVSSDGKVVVAGARGGVFLWDVESGAKKATAPVKPRGQVDAVGLSTDGNWLVISDRNDLTYWKWQTDEQPRTIHAGRRIISLAFSPDSRYLAEGPDSRGDIQIRDMRTLEVVRAMKDETGSPLYVDNDGVTYSTDGTTLIAGNAITVDESKLKIPHRIHYWDVETGQLRRQLATPHHQVWRWTYRPTANTSPRDWKTKKVR